MEIILINGHEYPKRPKVWLKYAQNITKLTVMERRKIKKL